MHIDALADRILDDLPSLAMLRAGFRLGFWSRLERGPVADLPAAFTLIARAAGMVAEAPGGGIALTDGMAALLARDARGLRARAEIGAIAAADLALRGDLLLAQPDQFRAAAGIFSAFRYDRAMSTGAAQIEDTEPWVDYVTALTETEAARLVPKIDLGGVGHVVEIGGNSGAFARALLAAHPGLRVTVIDLPAVCAIGRKAGNAEGRLTFLAGDARAIDWPRADAVLFKSVLHDWANDQAAGMLSKAAGAIPPGGRVIVCERGALAAERAMAGSLRAGNLVFANHYRAPDLYRTVLAEAGLVLRPDETITLDMTFHVTIAERRA